MIRTMNKHLRRELGEKKAKRLIRVYKAVWNFHPEWLDENGKFYKRLINTRVPCSCPFCGNPRKWFGENTRQEMLSELQMIEELDLTNEH